MNEEGSVFAPVIHQSSDAQVTHSLSNSNLCAIVTPPDQNAQMNENMQQNNKEVARAKDTEINDNSEIDFPGRPYASIRDAIKAKDYEAITPFIQSNNFNPDERGDYKFT
jgi:long-subunit acyl-CoA synthetase (AMP-forming)